MSEDFNLQHLGTAERTRITTGFVAQLKYYQDIKPWQNELRNAIWNSLVKTNRNYSEIELRDAVIAACEQKGGRLTHMMTYNLDIIAKEVDDFTAYYVNVIEESKHLKHLAPP